MYCRIQVIPHHHHQHLIIKAAELVSVFEAEIDHPLGLLKVKVGNFKVVGSCWISSTEWSDTFRSFFAYGKEQES